MPIERFNFYFPWGNVIVRFVLFERGGECSDFHSFLSIVVKTITDDSLHSHS